MNKRFAMTLLACVLVLVGIFWFVQDKAGAPEGDEQMVASSHKQGEGTSGVTLMEYSDFQCQECGAYYPVLKQVIAKYGDQITFQFRNFPLTQIHPNAMAAHRAAEAASLQDKFWEMHDRLYENQQGWKDADNVAGLFEGYAQQLGLNLDTFKEDYASSEVNQRINADIKEGEAVKVSSTPTPTFLINGKKIEETPRNIEEFSKLIDAAIAEQNPDTAPDSSTEAPIE